MRYSLCTSTPLQPEIGRTATGHALTRCRLATYRYENLHSEVLDYVVECFGSVQISPEFKECIKEVSQGLWGEEGGQVILGLFSRF